MQSIAPSLPGLFRDSLRTRVGRGCSASCSGDVAYPVCSELLDVQRDSHKTLQYFNLDVAPATTSIGSSSAWWP